MFRHPKIATIVWLACLTASGTEVRGIGLERYAIRRWGVEDGLPEGIVTSITQFPDGFIWLTTQRHVVRFDGVEFMPCYPEAYPARKPTRFKSLLRDRRGRVWVAGEDGVMLYDGDAWQAVYLAGAVDLNRATAWLVETPDGTIEQSPNLVLFWIKEHPDGTVWAASNAGMYRFDGQAFQLIPHDGLAIAGTFYSAAMDVRGRVWLSGREGLFEFDGKAYRRSRCPADSAEESWFQIFAGREETLWCKLQDGRMYRSSGETWEEVRPAGLRHAALLEQADGRVWYGTAEGVFLPNVTNWLVASGSGIDRAHDVRCFSETPDGSLWVGTGNGIFQIRRRSVRMFRASAHPSHQTVTALLQDGRGGFWAGVDGLGLLRGPAGAFQAVPTAPPVLPNATVTVLFAARDGTFWAGTREDHLWQVAPDGSLMQARTFGGNASRDITALAETPDGMLWAGSREGLLRKVAEQELKAAGGPEDAVLCLCADPAGGLWLGTQTKGLWRRGPEGGFRELRLRDGLPSDTVRAVHLDDDGNLWAGTPKGLFWLPAGTAAGGWKRGGVPPIRCFAREQGLLSDDVWQILDDGAGNLWLGARHMIMRVEKKEFLAVAAGRSDALSVRAFGSGDGLEGQLSGGDHQGPLAVATRDGKLWFATHAGLALVDQATPGRVGTPPPVRIEAISSINRQSATVFRLAGTGLASDLPEPDMRRPALALSAGSRDVTFRFTAPAYTELDRTRFRTRLDGFETVWRTPSAERQVVYPQLPPGRYRFFVSVSHPDGGWNAAEADVAFRVLPFFWQTAWFRLLAGTLALLAAGASVGFWVRRRGLRRLEAARLLAQEREREMAREQAVQSERIRIARDIHDDLGSGLTQMALLSELGQGEMGEPAKASARMDQIFSTASGLAKSLNEIVWAVNPMNDTLDSMLTYLGNYTDEYLRAAGVRFRIELPQECPALPVASAVRHHLFCAVREALHNTVKHAGAHEVRLRVFLDGPSLRVEISDDGKGFDPMSLKVRPGRNNGLRNMRHRMAETGGIFKLETAPACGTRLVFGVELTADVRRPGA